MCATGVGAIGLFFGASEVLSGLVGFHVNESGSWVQEAVEEICDTLLHTIPPPTLDAAAHFPFGAFAPKLGYAELGILDASERAERGEALPLVVLANFP